MNITISTFKSKLKTVSVIVVSSTSFHVSYLSLFYDWHMTCFNLANHELSLNKMTQRFCFFYIKIN